LEALPVFCEPAWVPGPPLAAALSRVLPVPCAMAKDMAPANNAAAIVRLFIFDIDYLRFILPQGNVPTRVAFLFDLPLLEKCRSDLMSSRPNEPKIPKIKEATDFFDDTK
jgi:hypothetical protein